MMVENDGYHGLSDLFAQLGLPNDGPSIGNFIRTHRALAHNLTLAEAPWWTPGQVSFIQEAIAEDSNWAIVVDKLDALLREEH
jgi:hypothetical protein